MTYLHGKKRDLKKLEELTDLADAISKGYIQVVACSDHKSKSPVAVLVIPCPDGTTIESFAETICQEARMVRGGFHKCYFIIPPSGMEWQTKNYYTNSDRYPDAPYRTTPIRGQCILSKDPDGVPTIKLNLNGVFQREELKSITDTVRRLQCLADDSSAEAIEPHLSELEKHC